MLNQLVKREQWREFALVLLALSLTLLSALPSSAQFHAERAIAPNETVLEYGSYRLSVSSDGTPDACDVVLFGFSFGSSFFSASFGMNFEVLFILNK